MLALAGRAIDTNDLWWHLALGATYAAEGPWPAVDPLLDTAEPGDAIPHEWLVGVLIQGVERVAGFPGLRAFHGLCAAGVLALTYSLFRRANGHVGLACTR